jgi:hypothetical protein
LWDFREAHRFNDPCGGKRSKYFVLSFQIFRYGSRIKKSRSLLGKESIFSDPLLDGIQEETSRVRKEL